MCVCVPACVRACVPACVCDCCVITLAVVCSLLQMNQMYKDYILKKGQPVPEDVEFPTLFEFYVLKWVKSYEEGAMNVTTKAVASDKNGQVVRTHGVEWVS